MRVRVPFFCLCLLWQGLPAWTAATSEQVLINRPESERDTRGRYFRKLLVEALRRTEPEYGRAQVGYAASQMTWERLASEARTGNLVQVFAAATRRRFEEDLIPVRIPLEKGALGFRVFLIRRETQPRFASIRTLEELKRLRCGLGRDWSITGSFEQLGFNVVASPKYENLFEMLQGDRFDYCPRGLTEALDELQVRQRDMPGIALEKTLLLDMPLPVYFFVTPARPRLAQRIQKGLRAMLADGSFDRAFRAEYGKVFRAVGIKGRRAFRVPNPDLGPETPLGDKALWLDLETLADGF